jgi:hypothetical protein
VGSRVWRPARSVSRAGREPGAFRGVAPATIMETLGHAVIHTTMQYAHVMPRSMREAAATMDDLLTTDDEGNGRSDGRKVALVLLAREGSVASVDV